MGSKKLEKICPNCNSKFIVFLCNNHIECCCRSCASEWRKKSGKTKGKDTCSLENFIYLYGEKDGLLKYNEWKNNISNSLKKSDKTKRNRKIKGKTYEEIYGNEKANEIKNKIKDAHYKNRKDLYEKKEKTKKKKDDNNGNIWTLGWFVEKYGEHVGTKKYNERCENLRKNSYFKIYNKKNKQNFSRISQNLFWKIYNRVKHKGNIYFGELNHEYSCGTDRNFDFVDAKNKKIIEFNGDNVHGNPHLYNSYDVLFHGLTVKEKRSIDKEKISKAENNGYEVLVIWEMDYKDFPNETLKECIRWLKNMT